MLQAIDALSHRVELLAMSLVSSHVTSTTNSLECVLPSSLPQLIH
jgi:hypothetical protein